jgi:hypothetical protein
MTVPYDPDDVALMIPHERFTEILKLLGAGNTAGLIAIIAALRAFPPTLYSGSLLKMSIVSFASGILTFSLAIAAHYVVMMTRYGPYWGGPKEPPGSAAPSSVTAAISAIRILTFLSVGFYFMGLISALVVLFEA